MSASFLWGYPKHRRRFILQGRPVLGKAVCGRHGIVASGLCEI